MVFNKTSKLNFDVCTLNTNFRVKDWNEPVDEQFRCFALAFESYGESYKFPSYYIWALLKAHGRKVVGKIQDEKHEFWNDIKIQQSNWSMAIIWIQFLRKKCHEHCKMLHSPNN